jgi:hypothetical protein
VCILPHKRNNPADNLPLGGQACFCRRSCSPPSPPTFFASGVSSWPNRLVTYPLQFVWQSLESSMPTTATQHNMPAMNAALAGYSACACRAFCCSIEQDYMVLLGAVMWLLYWLVLPTGDKVQPLPRQLLTGGGVSPSKPSVCERLQCQFRLASVSCTTCCMCSKNSRKNCKKGKQCMRGALPHARVTPELQLYIQRVYTLLCC